MFQYLVKQRLKQNKRFKQLNPYSEFLSLSFIRTFCPANAGQNILKKFCCPGINEKYLLRGSLQKFVLV